MTTSPGEEFEDIPGPMRLEAWQGHLVTYVVELTSNTMFEFMIKNEIKGIKSKCVAKSKEQFHLVRLMIDRT